MSTRLPVISARATASRSEPAASAERVAVPRTLLCVMPGGPAASAGALAFARALVAALAAGGREVAVLAARDESAGDAGLLGLREAGARAVHVLAAAQLPDSALAALAALSSETVAIAVGAALAARLQAALTIQVGRSQHAGALEFVDVELRGEAEAVASAIGAWLARR